MSKVVRLRTSTLLPIPAERVLQAAEDNLVDPVVVVGRDAEGKLYVAASLGEVGEIMLLLERAKAHLVRLVEEDESED